MRITKLETYVLTWPLDKPVFVSTSRIDAVHEVITRVSTDDGLVGLGQAHGAGTTTIGEIVQRGLAPIVLGTDPFAVERLWQQMFPLTWSRDAKALGWGPAQVMAAIAAVDIALWDLMGKAVGLPVAKLLGGYTDRVRAYATGGYYQEGKTRDDLAREMAGYVEMGYTAVKLKVGAVALAEDVARVAAVREAIGPNVDLIVDPNRIYSPTEAIAAAHAFAPYAIYWLEDPVRWHDDRHGLAEVALRSPIRIAAGEYENTKYGCRDLIAHCHLGVLMFDATWSGGLTEGRKVAGLADAHSLPLSPHHDPQIHVHLAAGFANGLILESFGDPSRDPLWTNLFTERAEFRDGYIEVPNRPGLGIELDEAVLKKYAVAIT